MYPFPPPLRRGGFPALILTATVLLSPGLFSSEGLLTSQDDRAFNIMLVTDYTAAEETIGLLQDEYVDTDKLAKLPGNRVAASTTGLIAGNAGTPAQLHSYLDSLRDHQIIRKDIFRLEEARTNVAAISDIVNALRKRNFSRKVIATVAQVFPPDANLTASIPVYVVALGHENADAYVRRIIWEGDTPRFTGEDEGELTIIINVAAAAAHPGTTEDRILSILMTVAHEVFHAAFALYKDSSPLWRRYNAAHQGPLYDLISLVQNEGIAYYLSLEERIGRALPLDWHERMTESFRIFNRNAGRLISGRLTPRETADIIYSANLSGYWESYGSMVGMSMARAVDLTLGRDALIETIRDGPLDLFRKYHDMTEYDSSLPRFSETLLGKLGIE